MTTVFLRILEMGLTASVVVAVVCLLRLLTGKVSKKVTCLLWALVAVRLLCPFSLQSPTSVMPARGTVTNQIAAVLPTPAPQAVVTETPVFPTAAPILPTVTASPVMPVATVEPVLPVEPVMPAVTASPVRPVTPVAPAATAAPAVTPAETKTPFPWLTLAASVWGAGVLAMLLYGALSSVLLRCRMRGAVRREGNVYESERAVTPFLLGMIRPRIYLPFRMDEATRAAVLSHENAHIKRGDHIVKPFAFLLLSVYWFNPLLWVSYFLLARDIELACDEKVAATLSETERREYAAALLACGVKKARPVAACPLAFGEVGVKARVKSVMNYKRPAFWLILAAVAAIIAAAVCLLTDPLTKTKTPDTPAPTETPVPTATPVPTPTPEPTEEPTEEPESTFDLSWLEDSELVFLGTDTVFIDENNDYPFFETITMDSYRLDSAQRSVIHAGTITMYTDWYTPTENPAGRIFFEESSRNINFICDRPLSPDGTSLGESRVDRWHLYRYLWESPNGTHCERRESSPIRDGVYWAQRLADFADYPIRAVVCPQGDVYFASLGVSVTNRAHYYGEWEFDPKESGRLTYDAESQTLLWESDKEKTVMRGEDGVVIYRKDAAAAGTVSCRSVGIYSGNNSELFAVKDKAGTNLICRKNSETAWTNLYPRDGVSILLFGYLSEEDISSETGRGAIMVTVDSGTACYTSLIDSDNGKELWRRNGIALTEATDNSGWGEPVVTTAIYGVYGNKLYRLDPKSGRTVWETTVKKSDETLLHIGDSFGGIECVTTNAGQTAVTMMKLEPSNGAIRVRQTEQAPAGVQFIDGEHTGDNEYTELGGTGKTRWFWYCRITDSWLAAYREGVSLDHEPTKEEVLSFGPEADIFWEDFHRAYVTVDGQHIVWLERVKHEENYAVKFTFTDQNGKVLNTHEISDFYWGEYIFHDREGNFVIGSYTFGHEYFTWFTPDGRLIAEKKM